MTHPKVAMHAKIVCSWEGWKRSQQEMSGGRHDDVSQADGGEYAMGDELKMMGMVMSLVGMKVGEMVGLS